MNRGKTKNFYKYKSSTDTQFHLKTNLLLEKTFRIQPGKGTKRSQKSFHFKFPNSPFASYPDPVSTLFKKKKKRRERDSIKFSYRSRRSSDHARRFIATCGRNPLGISRYSSVGEKCGQKPVTKTRWPRKIWGTILLTKRARGNKNRPPPPLKPTRSVGFSTVVVKSE